MVAMIEKRMRALIKIIKEKRKLMIKHGRRFQASENSYNQSLQELQEYTKKRDSYMDKLRVKKESGAV